MVRLLYHCFPMYIALAVSLGMASLATAASPKGHKASSGKTKQAAKKMPSGLSLSSSTKANSSLAHATSLSISKQKIYVNRVLVLSLQQGVIPAKHKLNMDPKQSLVTTLYEALKSRSSDLKKRYLARKGPAFRGRLAMYVDAGVPFRLVSEAMYTAGLAGYQQFYFAVCASAKQRKGCQAKAHKLRSLLADNSRSARARQKQVMKQNKQFIQQYNKTGGLLKSLSTTPSAPIKFTLRLKLDTQGVTLQLNHTDIPQGCDLSTKALNATKKHLPTFPRDAKSNALPLKQIKACLAKIKKMHPTQIQITLQVARQCPHREVISMLDACRSKSNGKQLFPQVTFALRVTP